MATNGSGRKVLWELLKKKYPKCVPSVPVGKKDKSGNIVTNHQGLKKLYLDTYIHRLRNRPLKKEFDLRLKLASGNKSIPWKT